MSNSAGIKLIYTLHLSLQSNGFGFHCKHSQDYSLLPKHHIAYFSLPSNMITWVKLPSKACLTYIGSVRKNNVTPIFLTAECIFSVYLITKKLWARESISGVTMVSPRPFYTHVHTEG